MDEPIIVYTDRSDIHAGSLEALRRGMADLARFVETHEPDILAYNVFFDEAGAQMSVVHVHRDSASLAFHLEVAGPEFAKVAQFITLRLIDVYGDVGEDLPAQLLQKANLLGNGKVTIHLRQAGFARVLSSQVPG
jgi:hypothetical protein